MAHMKQAPVLKHVCVAIALQRWLNAAFEAIVLYHDADRDRAIAPIEIDTSQIEPPHH
jgi:hypothetical protein